MLNLRLYAAVDRLVLEAPRPYKTRLWSARCFLTLSSGQQSPNDCVQPEVDI